MIYLSEHIWDFDLDEALATLSTQRREQALKFKHELGRRTCALAYQLLRQGLRELYGIADNPVFAYNEHGKPSIVDRPDIHFSLSHCRHAVACAVSDRPIGIDVESVREYKEPIARYAMNDSELRQIQAAADPALAFTRLWTMKEATFKLLGTGINDNLKTIIDVAKYKYTTVEDAQQRYIYTVCEPHIVSDHL